MHMNRYFLLIACLQLVRSITPVHPASTWGPLIFIFAISGARARTAPGAVAWLGARSVCGGASALAGAATEQ